MIIYRIYNTEKNKSYIGQTIQEFNKRKKDHIWRLNNDFHDNPYLQHVWNKYGQEAFIFEVLEECDSIKKLNQKEIEWIKSFKSLYKDNGYNLRTGGKNDKLSEETIKKMREQHTKKFGRVVHQYDLDGNWIKAFKSIMEAERKTGIDNSYIVACCKGREKQAKGYIWSYKKEQIKSLKERLKETVYLPVIQKNKKGKVINTYKSVAEASRNTDISNSSIYNNIHGRSNSAGGYIWTKNYETIKKKRFKR